MRLGLKLLAAGAALVAATPATAATIVAAPGASSYNGPTPVTYDFDSALAPVTGGLVTNGSLSGVRAQPFGSSGNYWTVGPTDGSPGYMDLSSFGLIGSISFLWGSVDTFNKIELLNAANVAIATFTGSQVSALANGNQSLPSTNPVVTIFLTGAEQSALTRLKLTSTTNAFEVDNFRINAVPEPGTWAMMLLGFGAIGFAMRRGRRVKAIPQVA